MITNLKNLWVINLHRLYNYITHLTILMKSILPQDISGQQLQTIMQTAIAPRPIAFASTVDAEGNVNLSPFSFSICSVPSLRLLFFTFPKGKG